MDYIKSAIPYHLHEFIGTTTVRLKKAFGTDPKEGYPAPHTVNLLWRNPVIGAELHFTPWQVGEVTSDIGGPESAYFTKLLNLAPLPVPVPEDLEFLVEYIARSPQAIPALDESKFDLCNAIGRNYTGIRSLARNLLNTFCDCVRTKKDSVQKQAVDNIHHLFGKNLLIKVIHILLGAIPQYSFAKGQLLLRTRGWITQDEKFEAWKQMEGAYDPATAMFSLLSVVESLQWHSNHGFYVVPNLLEFLNVAEEPVTNNYIQNHALSLSRFSLYVTAPNMTVTQVDKMAQTIRLQLIHWIAQLCSLVRAVNRASLQHSLQLSDDLFNWLSQRWSRGLLEIAAPRKLVCLQEFLLPDGRVEVRKGTIRRLSENALNRPSAQGRATKIGRSLVDSWGIYKIEVEKIMIAPPRSDSSVPWFSHNDTNFTVANRDKGLKTSVICLLDESNDEFKDAVQNSRFCVADLLHDILSVSSEPIPCGTHEWYKKAFGAFYYHFDTLRHTEQITSDFETRKKDEPAFYIELFQSLADETQDRLNVLDIGIGYGRLEKALYDEDDSELLSKTTFWGLDISLEMERRHDEYLLKSALSERYKIGEMVEIQEVFGDTKFDVAILAYTTFGCYSSDDKNKSVLEQIAGVLRPGGVLVLEQFNPCLKKSEMPIWPVAKPIDERLVELTKTTNFLPVNDDYTLYAGEYTYNERTPDGPRLIRRDEYCIRLYSESWLETVLSLPEIGFPKDDINFFANFNKDVIFSGSDDQKLMICVARKPRSSKEDAKAKIPNPEGLENLNKAQNLINRVNDRLKKKYADVKFLFKPKISRSLKWLNDNLGLLDDSQAENVHRACKWSSDERFSSIVLKANSAPPSKWEHDDLLAKALNVLVELLSTQYSQRRP